MTLAVDSSPPGGPVPAATAAPADSRSSVLSRMLLGLVAVELIALYAPTARWLVDRWTMSVWHNAHGFIIPPAVAYFAWQELKPLRSLPQSSSAWGFALFLPAVAMHVLDTGIHSQILSALSIVVALPGLSLLFLGWERTKAIIFPLGFMLFMIPIPLVFTERLHLALREIATVGTAAALPWLGVSVYADNMTLQLIGGTLSVGDACSGFSTLYASVAVAALVAFSGTDWRSRVIPLVAAAPIAIAANILRVILLVVLCESLGFWVLDTWMHPASGMLTFAIALPIILWLGTPRRGAAAS